MDYLQGAANFGIPQNADAELLAADTAKTLVTVRNANYTLYIQRITYTPTTVNAQAITIKDSAGTPVLVALVPASQSTQFVADFGIQGLPLTAGKNLTSANTAGPGGRFKIECYAKLSTVQDMHATNQ